MAGFVCPACHQRAERDQTECPRCGQPFAWDQVPEAWYVIAGVASPTPRPPIPEALAASEPAAEVPVIAPPLVAPPVAPPPEPIPVVAAAPIAAVAPPVVVQAPAPTAGAAVPLTAAPPWLGAVTPTPEPPPIAPDLSVAAPPYSAPVTPYQRAATHGPTRMSASLVILLCILLPALIYCLACLGLPGAMTKLGVPNLLIPETAPATSLMSSEAAARVRREKGAETEAASPARDNERPDSASRELAARQARETGPEKAAESAAR